MHFLLGLPTALSFLIVAMATVSIALFGLALVRRRYPAESLKENHEVAAIIFSAFGWFYAVMVAFAVFVTWTGYDEANKNLQLEVSSALDVFYGASAFPAPLDGTIRQGMIEYLRLMDEDELKQMSAENLAFHSMGSLRSLMRLVGSTNESSLRNRELYSQSLQRLDGLAQYRRLRIFSGSNTVPPVLWLVLLCGAIITIACTYFFGMRHSYVQQAMTAALTLMLTLVLFLIYVLDHPFTGTNRISDAPLKQALAIMREQGARSPGSR